LCQRTALRFFAHRSSSGHAELVSASVRGDVLEMARCEILKFVIEREQSQACLNYAEREQIEQR
ncbi:MAG: hypothetical protein IIV67_04545, partial [Bacteroidaceae bacterium]|nr:hypothetical protein [Bacteroidaceae bacterium]